MLSPDPDSQKVVDRILAALRTAIRLSGVSYRQIERDLGMSTGYLTRILASDVQLRFAHVVGVCQIIGLPIESFFAALYPPRRPASDRETRLIRGLAQLHPSPVPPSETDCILEELRAFLQRLEGGLRERE